MRVGFTEWKSSHGKGIRSKSEYDGWQGWGKGCGVSKDLFRNASTMKEEVHRKL